MIGLAEGGYAYFGDHGLQIGWPHGWHSNLLDAMGVAGLSYWQTPGDFTSALPGPIQLYVDDVNAVSIYMPTPISGVTELGWESADNDHAPLIAEQGKQSCQQLWGFGGAPDSDDRRGQAALHQRGRLRAGQLSRRTRRTGTGLLRTLQPERDSVARRSSTSTT